MIPTLGSFSLIFAALLQLICPLLLFSKKSSHYIKFNIVTQSSLIILSFICLIISFVTSDYSVLLVVNHSHDLKPLLYKITGTWGNHEGSMLLWLTELCIINLLFVIYGNFEEKYKEKILSIQSIVSFLFSSFIIITSNPFTRVFPAASTGRGLNPLLQDIGLSIHPPALYGGYVGLSIAFSSAIVALYYGSLTKAYVRAIRSWVIAAWSLLTLGISLGGWWAYRELGWGGFWFWDPVENSSLIPWLAATALIHSLAVVERTNSLKLWSLLLCICCFILSILGTFLVRSGILTSVHNFASDPKRGLFILFILSIISLFSLLTFIIYAVKMEKANKINLISTEGFIVIGNLLLSTACFTIILGTIYPIFYQLLNNQSITVGTPYFNSTFIPIILPLLILAAIAPNIINKKNIFFAIIPTSLVTTFISYYFNIYSVWFILGIAFSTYLIFSILLFYSKNKEPIKIASMCIAHLGLAIFSASITLVSHLSLEENIIAKVEDKINIGKFTLIVKEIEYDHGKNYLIKKAKILVTHNKNELTYLYPEVRLYPVEKTTTSESSIYSTFFNNLYTVIGNSDNDNNIQLRIYYKPFINGIWYGLLLMIISGIISIYIRNRKNEN